MDDSTPRALAALLLLTAGAGACSAARTAQAEDEPAVRPNLVVVLTDDQGYGDFAHAGHPALETPHLDALARQSPRIERFYVSPVCSPTRASLLTGRWNYRTRVVDTWVGRSMMEPDEVTIAEWLGDHGYRTGLFGKWHLGDCYPLRPQDQGFDRVLVHRGGGLAQPSEPPENDGAYTDAILFEDGEEVRTEGYCTDVYFDAAERFVDAAVEAGEPFFALVSTNAPHGPFGDVPQELYERALERDLAAALPAGSDRVDREARIVAMVENIDANVGRLLAHLEARGVADDTLFVFLCDNGPVGGRYTAGLRGAKGSVYEGGIRTRLFARWPGRLQRDTVVSEPLAHVDLFPTLVEAAGLPAPDHALDGRSFLGPLCGTGAPGPERTLFLQSHRGDAPTAEHNFAAVGPRWKLLRASGFGREEPAADHPFELYDLRADPDESDDLAAARPDVMADLRARYAAWFRDVSSTRPHNYAPPRIVVGDPAERRTVLTRQDWRGEGGGGWGRSGRWLLESERGTEKELVLVLREPAAVARVVVRIGDETRELAPGVEAGRVALGSVRLPAGPFDLAVDAEGPEGERVQVHQVELGE